LRVETGAIDLERFELLLGRCQELLAGGSAADAAATLRDALALWRGPALAEFSYDAFARSEIGRLNELRLLAIEQRLDAELALGLHADLVGELEMLVAQHPHREHFRRQLMLTLYRSGRQAEALESYRVARAALNEIGLEPGAVLRQLERQTLTQDISVDVGSVRLLAGERPPLPGPLLPTPPFPFVGRSDELAGLRSLLVHAEAGEGGVVLLAGGAGIGKTRLLRELASHAVAKGTLVLYGTSDPVVSAPYQPLLEWFAFLLRVAEHRRCRRLLRVPAHSWRGSCLNSRPSAARLRPNTATQQATGSLCTAPSPKR
jgi:hypothetical protein